MVDVRVDVIGPGEAHVRVHPAERFVVRVLRQCPAGMLLAVPSLRQGRSLLQANTAILLYSYLYRFCRSIR